MKTRISKRLLSVVLSAMMIVTSIPMVAITASADTDPVQEVQDAMAAFETKLDSPAIFTNVSPAYDAFVECQKALDAYIYGGESDALNGKAQALITATNAIQPFVTKRANAVPTFPNSAVGDMQEYVNDGTISQILYSETAIYGNAANNAQVSFRMVYNPETVVLYDSYGDGNGNVPEIRVPVMADAYLSNHDVPDTPDNNGSTSTAYERNGKRYLYSVYPAQDTAGVTDDANWNLVGYWRSGLGTDPNWNWNWWTNSPDHDPAYNANTGCASNGKNSTDYRSKLPDVTRSGSIGWFGSGYRYTSHEAFYSNILKYVGSAPTGQSVVTTIPYWYCSSGDGANSAQDDKSTGGFTITVVNYDFLTNAIRTNGEKMKSIDLMQYSEGTLSGYIQAMENATNFNPNTYFNGTNGTSNCGSAMNNLKNAMNNADTTTTNSAAYAALRSAMSDDVRSTFSATNTNPATGALRYTADSWSDFERAYNDAKTVMGNCNNSGYTDSTAAAKAEALAYAYDHLVPNTAKVDTTALMAVISVIQNDMLQVFTDETYNLLIAKVRDAMSDVWRPDGTEAEGESVYGVKAKALDLTDENQALVDSYVSQINTLITNLRFSMDVVVTTTEGKFSMNSALALVNEISDPSDYGNYSTFATAVANGQYYATDVAPRTPLTDYATQLQNHKNEIAKVVAAFNALTFAFTKIPDGELANVGQFIDMEELTQGRNNNRYAFKFQFSYNTDAIVFKTTHDSKAYRFGDALIRFTVNLDDNVSKENNCLDSITINTTENSNADAAVSGEFTSTPKELSGSQKESYKACLAVDGFSINNFRFHSQANNSKDFLGVDNAGNKFYRDAANESEKLYECLSQTNGERAFLANGGVFVQPSLKKDAVITVAGDFCVDTPATPKTTLDRNNTIPVTTTYSLTDKYVGAVYCWNVQPTGAWAGYSFVSYKESGQALNINVTVVDISYLIDLVNQCNTIAGDADKYTTGTWTTFQQKLVAAQANMNYTALSSAQINTQVIQRYQNLWDAYDALELRAYNTPIINAVAQYAELFSTHNADGIYSDSTWADFETAFTAANNTILANAIYSTENIKTVPATEQGTIDALADALIAAYGRLVKVADLAADWNAYNAALSELVGMLQNKTLSVSALNAIVSGTVDMLYTQYTAAQKQAATGAIQPSINTETSALLEIINAAKADQAVIAAVDYSAAESYATDYDAVYGNDDMYAGDNTEFAYTAPVSVPLVNDSIEGMIYTDQDTLDDAITASLESKDIREYSIYLTSEDGEEVLVGSAKYGEPVIVDADGTVTNNAADTAVNNEELEAVSWFYSYNAPSLKSETPSNPKYILTAPSYGFIVKGDTYLNIKTEDKTETNYCVKFAAKVGGAVKIFDVKYTTAAGQVQMPDVAPNYAGYKFTGYSNGAVANAWVNVDKDTVIFANYEANKLNTFNIDFYDGLEAFDMADATFEDSFAYNTLVSCDSSIDPFCWTIADYDEDTYVSSFKIIAYGGDNYSFYACQNISDGSGIVPLSEEDYYTIVDDYATNGEDAIYLIYNADGSQILTTGGNEIDGFTYAAPKPQVDLLDDVVTIYKPSGDFDKFSLIGTFVLPAGYQMVETGFLFTTQSGKDLTIENVGTSGIARFKAARYTIGNQFVVNVTTMLPNFEYVGYAVITHQVGGKTVYETIYSSKNIVTGYNG